MDVARTWRGSMSPCLNSRGLPNLCATNEESQRDMLEHRILQVLQIIRNDAIISAEDDYVMILA